MNVVKLMVLMCVFAFSDPAPAFADDLNVSLETLLQTQGMQGAVWSTLNPDGTVAVGAAGIKNAANTAKMRPDDRVHIGSVAKTLLAAGVLRLVSEGRLSLESPVSDLLPDMPLKNRWATTDPVRLRHLLDHTAGLDDARLSQVFSLIAGADTPLAHGFVRGGSLLHVRSRPGTRFSYSNMSYALVGRVIESVTGQRYESYLDVHLLRPLGMHDSTFSFVAQSGPHGDPRLAMGHVENGATHAAVPTYLRPAGQFTTTAADMAKFAGFLMSSGQLGGRPFITSTLLHAMGSVNATDAANGGLQVGFALGLATRDRHGAIGKCHGGSTVGYRAMFCIFPEQHKAYFIAINTDSETANYGQFDALMVKALLLQPPPQPRSSSVAFDAADWDGYYILAPNRFASVAWVDTVLNFARLRKITAGVQFTPFQSPAVKLTHVTGALFRVKGRISPSHVLLTGSTGEKVVSSGTQSYEKISLFKLVPLWASLILGLLGLTYIFVSGLIRIAMGRINMSHPLLVPFTGVVAILLPLPLLSSVVFTTW